MSYKERYDFNKVAAFEKLIKWRVRPAFERLGLKISQHSGECGGLHDFVLENGKTLSVKTNKGDLGKVCPQVIGQTTTSKLLIHLGLPFNADYVERVNTLQDYTLSNLSSLLSDYLEYLTESDYLLFFYNCESEIEYLFVDCSLLKKISFEQAVLSKNKEQWVSSNQVKIGSVNIGEFQCHSSRDCFKFRFNFKGLVKFIEFSSSVKNESPLEALKESEDNSYHLILLNSPQGDLEVSLEELEDKDINVLNCNPLEDKVLSKKLWKDLLKESYSKVSEDGCVFVSCSVMEVSEIIKEMSKLGYVNIRTGLIGWEFEGRNVYDHYVVATKGFFHRYLTFPTMNFILGGREYVYQKNYAELLSVFTRKNESVFDGLLG